LQNDYFASFPVVRPNPITYNALHRLLSDLDAEQNESQPQRQTTAVQQGEKEQQQTTEVSQVEDREQEGEDRIGPSEQKEQQQQQQTAKLPQTEEQKQQGEDGTGLSEEMLDLPEFKMLSSWFSSVFLRPMKIFLDSGLLTDCVEEQERQPDDID